MSQTCLVGVRPRASPLTDAVGSSDHPRRFRLCLLCQFPRARVVCQRSIFLTLTRATQGSIHGI
jgi:hypothetical protein